MDLPTSYRADAFEELLATMRLDKKARADRLRFVVLEGLAKPRIVDNPDLHVLQAAYREISADA